MQHQMRLHNKMLIQEVNTRPNLMKTLNSFQANFPFLCPIHCVKSVQIRSFFWSVFSCIQSKYREIRTRKNSVFGHFSRSDMLKWNERTILKASSKPDCCVTRIAYRFVWIWYLQIICKNICIKCFIKNKHSSMNARLTEVVSKVIETDITDPFDDSGIRPHQDIYKKLKTFWMPVLNILFCNKTLNFSWGFPLQ